MSQIRKGHKICITLFKLAWFNLGNIFSSSSWINTKTWKLESYLFKLDTSHLYDGKITSFFFMWRGLPWIKVYSGGERVRLLIAFVVMFLNPSVKRPSNNFWIFTTLTPNFIWQAAHTYPTILVTKQFQGNTKLLPVHLHTFLDNFESLNTSQTVELCETYAALSVPLSQTIPHRFAFVRHLLQYPLDQTFCNFMATK